MKTKLTILTLAVVLFTQTGCWVTATEGSVQVRTVSDRADLIIRPDSGGVYSYNVWWDEYYPINLRTKTIEVDVSASSKDNAGANVKVAVTYHLKSDDESIFAFVRKFGLVEDSAQKSLNQVLIGQVNTETKTAFNKFDAYSILANQDAIQDALKQSLTPIFSQQLYLDLESVQIIGRPDFIDDRIETASSGVVAAKKKQEEEDALKTAALTRQQRLEIEAKTFENPKMFRLEELKLQKEIAAEWAKHNGTLVLGKTDTSVQIQDK